jgi:hypothetical protein
MNVPAETPPPEKEAAPAKEAAKSSSEHLQTDIGSAAEQAQDSRLSVLIKAWLRARVTERRLFIADIRAGNPNLWEAVERDAGGRGL